MKIILTYGEFIKYKARIIEILKIKKNIFEETSDQIIYINGTNIFISAKELFNFLTKISKEISGIVNLENYLYPDDIDESVSIKRTFSFTFNKTLTDYLILEGDIFTIIDLFLDEIEIKTMSNTKLEKIEKNIDEEINKELFNLDKELLDKLKYNSNIQKWNLDF